MIVDIPGRTITYLAVPYGQVGNRDGRLVQFDRGSVTWDGRVRLLAQHDPATRIGRAVELIDTEQGLRAVLSVASGKAGDRALALAAAGTWRGLSIGLGDGYVYELVGDVWHGSGRIVEISLTPTPAFEVAA